MARQLAGKSALVTGASTGIGRAVATALAEEGCDVAVHFRDVLTRAEETAEAVRRHGGRTLIVRADVSRKDEVEALLRRVVGAFGKVDFLVNAAGILGRRAEFDELPVETWDDVMAVNARGTFLCCQAALREMMKRERGKIVNVSATWDLPAGAGTAAPFAASKAAVEALTLLLAREYAPYGITVNAVAPGVVDTPMHEKSTPAPLYDMLVRSQPWGRAGTAHEVAQLVRHLLSPAGDAISGEIVRIAAGRWPWPTGF